jgi:hypothetical protein
MHTAEIIIFVIVGILAVYGIRNNQKYVDSIKIGDTFGHDLFKFSNIDDPFCEDYDTQGFDPYYHVTILDIKKNNKGETWVKYCFTRVLNNHHCEWTEEINEFLRYRTRISKRIDNINTNE